MQLEELQAIWETQTERPVFFGQRFRIASRAVSSQGAGSTTTLLGRLLHRLRLFAAGARGFARAVCRLLFQRPGKRLSDECLGRPGVSRCGDRDCALRVVNVHEPKKTREGSKRVRSFPAAGNRTRHRSNRLRDLYGHEQDGLAKRRARLSRRDTHELGSRASERRSPAVGGLMDDRRARGRDVRGPGARESAGCERGAAAQTGARRAAREARREPCWIVERRRLAELRR